MENEYSQLAWLEPADYIPEMERIQNQIEKDFVAYQQSEELNSQQIEKNTEITANLVDSVVDFSKTAATRLAEEGKRREQELLSEQAIWYIKNGIDPQEYTEWLHSQHDATSDSHNLYSIAAFLTSKGDDASIELARQLEEMSPSRLEATQKILLRDLALTYDQRFIEFQATKPEGTYTRITETGETQTYYFGGQGVHAPTSSELAQMRDEFDRTNLSPLITQGNKNFVYQNYTSLLAEPLSRLNSTNRKARDLGFGLEQVETIRVNISSLSGTGTNFSENFLKSFQLESGLLRSRGIDPYEAYKKILLSELGKGEISEEDIYGLLNYVFEKDGKEQTLLDNQQWKTVFGSEGELLDAEIATYIENKEGFLELSNNRSAIELVTQWKIDNPNKFPTQIEIRDLFNNWRNGDPSRISITWDEAPDAFKKLLSWNNPNEEEVRKEFESRIANNESWTLDEFLQTGINPNGELAEELRELYAKTQGVGLSAADNIKLDTKIKHELTDKFLIETGEASDKLKYELMSANAKKFFLERYRFYMDDKEITLEQNPDNLFTEAWKDTEAEIQNQFTGPNGNTWVQLQTEEQQSVAEEAAEQERANLRLASEWLGQLKIGGGEPELFKTIIPGTEAHLNEAARISRLVNGGDGSFETSRGEIPSIYFQMARGNNHLSAKTFINAQFQAYNTLNQNTEGFEPIPLFPYTIQELELQSQSLQDQQLVAYHPSAASGMFYIIKTLYGSQGPFGLPVFNYEYEDIDDQVFDTAIA